MTAAENQHGIGLIATPIARFGVEARFLKFASKGLPIGEIRPNPGYVR